MRHAQAVEQMTRLHHAQNRLYQGGDPSEVREILDTHIAWHIPGDNAIAGDYHGHDQVIAYMLRRRDLAAATMRMHPRELLVGDDDHVASRTDGTATINRTTHHWSTLGLYRLGPTQIRECWLLPLDPRAFDAIWSTPTNREHR
jgi:ketosteroid isomerase-like protein